MPEGAVGLHEDIEDLEHDGAAYGVVAGSRALRYRVKVTVHQQGVLCAAPARFHLGDDVLDVSDDDGWRNEIRENYIMCILLLPNIFSQPNNFKRNKLNCLQDIFSARFFFF